MLSTLELVSVSDFVLSALCIFISGLLFSKVESHSSAKGMLCYFILFTGISAFMGGLDHGFFEPKNQRYIPRTLTYIFMGAATFTLFRFVILSYIQGKMAKFLMLIAYLQLASILVCSFLYHNFLLIVLNYSPILLLFFIMNLIHYKRSKSIVYYIGFCLLTFLATFVQLIDGDIYKNFNSDTLFHIILCIAVGVLYKGVSKISINSLEKA